MSSAKQTVINLLADTGISINGDNPSDLQINNERFYSRVLAEGALGLGESYMDGDWDCEALDEMVASLLRSNLNKKVNPIKLLWPVLKAKFSNQQRKAKSLRVGKQHYDIGNDLYKRMLDPRMVYTCAYWKGATTLAEAQEAKLDLICRKIGLKAGMRVLDIGCGWGSFAGYAAEKYGCSVVGVTISREQLRYAAERYQDLDVEFRFQDYRELDEPFDRIVSIGMFEHVGPKNYRAYFEVARRCLVEDGYFLLHTIGGSTSRSSTDPWTEKYIFPGGVLPSSAQIAKAAEGLLVMKDWHNFGAYYDRTLMAWNENFEAAKAELTGYDERFFRMWRYWLHSAAAGFRSNRSQLWQIVYAKLEGEVLYDSVR
jgi:cyclopropane-fatty-acyl-phospholipid synthase